MTFQTSSGVPAPVSDTVAAAVKREQGGTVLGGFVEVGPQTIRGHREPMVLWGLEAAAIGCD